MPLSQVRGDMGRAHVPVRLRTTFAMLVGASAVVLGASTVVLGAPPLAAAPVVLPSPCPLAPFVLVAPALGVNKAKLHPVTQSGRSDGFALETCVFTHGADHVTVTLAPAAYGSGGASLPGLVTSHPAGLGQGHVLARCAARACLCQRRFCEGPVVGRGLFQRARAGAVRAYAGPLRVRAPAPRLNPTSLPGLNQALEPDLWFGRAADSIDDVPSARRNGPCLCAKRFSDFLRHPEGPGKARSSRLGLGPGVAWPKSRFRGVRAGRAGKRAVPRLPSRTASSSHRVGRASGRPQEGSSRYCWVVQPRRRWYQGIKRP